MDTLYFAASAPLNDKISHKEGENGSLKVDVLATVIGSKLPCRDKDGNIVKVFSTTEEMIQSAVESFSGNGKYNVNHSDKTIGSFDKVSNDGGRLLTSGQITCPIWCELLEDDEEEYSGVSIEGSFPGLSVEDINSGKQPKSMTITAVSFLKDMPPACDKDLCTVEVKGSDEVGDKKEPDVSVKTETSVVGEWNPSYDQYWSYIETKEGKIRIGRARQIFLKKTGNGLNRGDWHYPIAKIVDGSPVIDPEGIRAALARASQQRDQEVLSALRRKYKQAGEELPPSLKGSRIEASYDEKNQKFSARLIDDDENILAEKEIIVIKNSSNTGDIMVKDEIKEEAKVEAKPEPEPVVATPTVEVKPPEVKPPEVEAKPTVAETKPIDPWAIVKETLGVDKDSFEALKSSAEKVSSYEKQFETMKLELDALKGYKVSSEKEKLKSRYPPALWEKDIDAFHKEFSQDPAGFSEKYFDDAVKFAASKSATIAGSNTESIETEEAKESAKVKSAVTSLKKRAGVVN